MKLSLQAVVLFLIAALSVSGFAQTAYVEGKHYTRLSEPVRTVNPKKIEVVEVFSYHCGHCYAFEPMIQAWKKSLPPYVAYVPMQAQWDSNLTRFARAQLTAKALHVEEKVHPAMFSAVQIPGQRVKMISNDEIEKIFTQAGVSTEKFEKTFNSFGVDSQLKQQKEKLAAYKVNSTPTIIVDGQYVVNATTDIDHQGMLDITNFLIEKLRKERGLE